MGKFHDTLSSVGVGEDGVTVAYPETFSTDLTAAYDEDFAGAAATINLKDQEIARISEENTRLKAHNYELLTSIPAATEPVVSENEGEDENDTDDEGTDSLFGSDDDDDK